MQRPPRQARSAASMERMLDAAESLMAEGGPDALTVEAVIARAGTSNGSFYARFGDRAGLLLAMQSRLLERVERELVRRLADLGDDDDLEVVVGRLVAGFLGAFRRHRSAFHAFIVQNRSVPEMRARSNAASRATARAVRDTLRAHAAEIAHPDVDVAADMVFRTLFALGTQRVMFDDREVTGRDPSLAVWERELTRLLVGYLRTPAAG